MILNAQYIMPIQEIEMGDKVSDSINESFVPYEDLRPCTTAFIDARTPGSDRKENFTIIGSGVSENPNQYVHIKIPHGFNIGAARQPAGCVNSQHSHETEEVFFVHSGRWVFTTGPKGEGAQVTLNEGDLISIPTNIFRGFECIEGEQGFLFAVLGRDDPGHVTWAPHVIEEAGKHGLVLLENGRLIDTKSGEPVPEGAAIHEPISDEAAHKDFNIPTQDELESCVVRSENLQNQSHGKLCERSAGVYESVMIGAENSLEGLPGGPISYPHGFCVRRVIFAPGGAIPQHVRTEEEVVFVHSGQVNISTDIGNLTLKKGDTLSVPKGTHRKWLASSSEEVILLVVRGGDRPQSPNWD